MGDAAVRIVSAFRRTDKDGNGYVTKDELFEVLSELAPGKWTGAKVDKLIEAIDTNGDGVIQYEEFVSFLFAKTPTWHGARKSLVNEETNGRKVVKPVEIVPDLPEVIGKRKQGDGYGRMIVFFDVDGVLNSTEEFPSSSEEESEEEEEKEDDEAKGKDEADATGKKEADDTVTDPLGRWAARLSKKCLERLRLVLASFDEGGKGGARAEAGSEEGAAKERASGEEQKSEVAEGGEAAQASRVRLVLTSTWRMSEEQTSFIKWALAEAGIPESLFFGTTACVAGATRGEEVLHFLGELAVIGRDVAAWVVLDSDHDNLQALPDVHQVHTWEVSGLCPQGAQQTRSSLAAQDAAWAALRGLPAPGYPADFELERKKKAAQERAKKGRRRRKGREAAGDSDGDSPARRSKSPTRPGVTQRRGSSAMAATEGRRRSASPGGPRRRSLSPPPRSPSPSDQPVLPYSMTLPADVPLSRQSSKNSTRRSARRRSVEQPSEDAEVPRSRPASSRRKSAERAGEDVETSRSRPASSRRRSMMERTDEGADVPRSSPGASRRRSMALRTDEDVVRPVSTSRSARRKSIAGDANPQEPVSRGPSKGRADEDAETAGSRMGSKKRANRGNLLDVPS